MGPHLNSFAWPCRDFPLCHRLGFRCRQVWQLQTVGLAQAPLPCACGCLRTSPLQGSELPFKSFIPPPWSGAEGQTGPRWTLHESGAYVPGLIRLPREVPGGRLERPSLWFCVSPSGLSSWGWEGGHHSAPMGVKSALPSPGHTGGASQCCVHAAGGCLALRVCRWQGGLQAAAWGNQGTPVLWQGGDNS